MDEGGKGAIAVFDSMALDPDGTSSDLQGSNDG